MVQEFDQYLERFNDQATWYEAAADKNKVLYYLTRFTALALAGAIPIITVLGNDLPYSRVVLAFTSFVLLITEGSLALFSFNENWRNYRIVYEKLMREKAYFDTRSGRYANNEGKRDPENVFILRIEELLAEENNAWVQYAEDVDENVRDLPE